MPKKQELASNLYGTLAMGHWEEFLPEAYKELEANGTGAISRFFTALGEKAGEKHTRLADQMTAQGRSVAEAETIAREIVLAEDIYIQPISSQEQ